MSGPLLAFLTTSVILFTVVKPLQVCKEIVHLGGYYGNHKGSFSSPGYPSDYPINAKCVWMIKVPIGYRVKLEFSDFEVESCAVGGRACTCDAVDVFDGQLSVNKRLSRSCGPDIPAVVYSSDRYMRVELTSDSSGQDMKGFSASYESVSPDGSGPTSNDMDSNKKTAATPSPKDDSANSGSHSTVMIATICSILGVIVIGLIIVFVVHKKKRDNVRRQAPSSGDIPSTTRAARPSASRTSSLSTVPTKQEVYPEPNIPPPPYAEVISIPLDQPPPAYHAGFSS